MSSEDFVIDDAATHFAASKSSEYRSRVEQRFRSFVQFLQRNGLTTREVLSDDEPVTEQLKIRKSDLTTDGFEVVKSSYDKWLRALDKGKDVSDVSLLEKTLAKVTAKS